MPALDPLSLPRIGIGRIGPIPPVDTVRRRSLPVLPASVDPGIATDARPFAAPVATPRDDAGADDRHTGSHLSNSTPARQLLLWQRRMQRPATGATASPAQADEATQTGPLAGGSDDVAAAVAAPSTGLLGLLDDLISGHREQAATGGPSSSTLAIERDARREAMLASLTGDTARLSAALATLALVRDARSIRDVGLALVTGASSGPAAPSSPQSGSPALDRLAATGVDLLMRFARSPGPESAREVVDALQSQGVPASQAMERLHHAVAALPGSAWAALHDRPADARLVAMSAVGAGRETPDVQTTLSSKLREALRRGVSLVPVPGGGGFMLEAAVQGAR